MPLRAAPALAGTPGSRLGVGGRVGSLLRAVCTAAGLLAVNELK